MRELIALLLNHGIAIVFVVTLAARVGLPVPASPLLVIVGGLASSGQFSIAGAAVAAVVANLLGDGLWFAAGRRHGHRVMRLLCRISMSPDSCVRQSESLIVRWGGSSLIAAKFVPGVSVVAAPMAGALHMPLWRFVAFDLVGALAWTLAFVLLGVLFKNQIQEVLDVMARTGALATTVIVIVLAAMLALRYWRRRRFLREVEMSRISVGDLRELMRQEVAPLVIDVRSDASVQIDGRRIPGAISLHLDEVPDRAAALPRDRDIVLYCNCPNEVSAARGARLLAERGLTRVRPLAGGLDAWVASGHEVDTMTLRHDIAERFGVP